MWGATSFSELAKKAQEASELATKKAQEASSSMNSTLGDTSGISSIFNLDSMIAKSGSFGNGDGGDDDGSDAKDKDNDTNDDSKDVADGDIYEDAEAEADVTTTGTAASSTTTLSRLSPMPEISESPVTYGDDDHDDVDVVVSDNNDGVSNSVHLDVEVNGSVQNGHNDDNDAMPDTVKMNESMNTDDGDGDKEDGDGDKEDEDGDKEDEDGEETFSMKEIDNNLTVETGTHIKNDENHQSPSPQEEDKTSSLTSVEDTVSPIAKSNGNHAFLENCNESENGYEYGNENEFKKEAKEEEEEVLNGDCSDGDEEGEKNEDDKVLEDVEKEDDAKVVAEVEGSDTNNAILDHEEAEENAEPSNTNHINDTEIPDAHVDEVVCTSSFEEENAPSTSSFTNNEIKDDNNAKEENDDEQAAVPPDSEVSAEVGVAVETEVKVDAEINNDANFIDSQNMANGIDASTASIDGQPERDEQSSKENVGLSINTNGYMNGDVAMEDSIISPLSKNDERAMSFSMAESTEKCDSEKDLDVSQDIDSDDDINGMYEDDDGEESKGENVSAKENEDDDKGEANTLNASQETQDPNSLPPVPQFAIEKFMSQLERLHQQHEGEMQEMERKHQVQIGEMKEKIDSATSQKNSRNEIVSNDKFLAQLRKLERDFDERLEKKDGEIADLVEINKLMEGQIDDLKCETDVLKKSLEARNEMIAKVKEKDEEIESLKTSLKDTQGELESSNESFATLKGRVKVVATELKERRVECRNLNVNVEDLTLSKSKLESENKDFAMKLSKLEQIKEERDQEIGTLRQSVAELRLGLKSKEKELVDKGSVGDKALNSYKKKAQTLLGNANARAAAANQAREDAEIDATNARAEAENASKLAREAEKEKAEIVSESLKEVHKLQKEVDELKLEKEKIAVELQTTQTECFKAFDDVKESQEGRDSLLNDLNAKEIELEKEIEKTSGLEQDAAMARIKTKDLEDQIASLKYELEKATTAVFMARKREAEAQSNVSSSTFGSGGYNHEQKDKNDSTIFMLQQELEVANDVIKDLKETLATIISEDPSNFEPDELIKKVNSFGEDEKPDNGVNGNDSTPLFFAFEKQAELNTARDEITRLALLLGDAESEKMEATEAKEEMRIKMEEAESRLRRFEKLGAASGGRQGNGSHGGRFGTNSSHFHAHSVGNGSSHSDSSVNLEYLKNIMLRYMNAMSLNEKKALIPVIAAVLELTADEQAKALESVESSAGIQGVGTSLIENVQNKGFVNGLFGDIM